MEDREAMKVLEWVHKLVKYANENFSIQTALAVLKKIDEHREVVKDAFFTAIRPEFREKADGILKAMERGI